MLRKILCKMGFHSYVVTNKHSYAVCECCGKSVPKWLTR